MSLKIVKNGLSDWQKLGAMIVSPNPVAHRKGVQYFLELCSVFLADLDNPIIRSGLQEFAVSGHFPAKIYEIIEKFPEFKDFDVNYERIFDIKDYTGSGKPGFKIRGIVNGMAFATVPTGDKAQVYGISGEDVTVDFTLYGAGLDISKLLFDDEDYYSIEEALVAFRAAEASKRATVFYALIEAVTSGQNTTWQGATGDAEAVRDIKTINSACGSIISDLEDQGYNLGMNPEFLIASPDTAALRRRLAQALNVTGQAYAGSPTLLSYNVGVFHTLKFAAATSYYVCLPKRKLKGGNRMNLTLMNQPGILSYSETIAGWGRYGGAIGEVKQIRRCAIS